MTKLILTLLFLATAAGAAEFLVRAKDNTMDNYDETVMTASALQAWNARLSKGDIWISHDNGFGWGTCECLPDWIIVCVPEMTALEASQYEGGVFDTDAMPQLERRYMLPESTVDYWKSNGMTKVTVSKDFFMTKLTDKKAQ